MTRELVLAALAALVCYAYTLPPDPPGNERAESLSPQTGYSAHAARAAALTTITVVLAMIAFLVFNWPTQLLIVLCVGLLILISTSVGEGASLDANILTRIHFIFTAGMYVIWIMSITESVFDRFGLFGPRHE